MSSKKGVILKFNGLSFIERLGIWYKFTLGCLFLRNTNTLPYRLKEIEIVNK